MKLICIKTDESFKILNYGKEGKFLPPQIGKEYNLDVFMSDWNNLLKTIHIELESIDGTTLNSVVYPKDCFLPLDEYRNKQIESILQ